MSLSFASMSASIQAEIIVQFGSPADSTRLQEFCDALGKAIVENIQANAVVHVTAVQPGVGTANGTVS